MKIKIDILSYLFIIRDKRKAQQAKAKRTQSESKANTSESKANTNKKQETKCHRTLDGLWNLIGTNMILPQNISKTKIVTTLNIVGMRVRVVWVAVT
jgi:hypothetical protein